MKGIPLLYLMDIFNSSLFFRFSISEYVRRMIPRFSRVRLRKMEIKSVGSPGLHDLLSILKLEIKLKAFSFYGSMAFKVLSFTWPSLNNFTSGGRKIKKSLKVLLGRLKSLVFFFVGVERKLPV